MDTGPFPIILKTAADLSAFWIGPVTDTEVNI